MTAEHDDKRKDTPTAEQGKPQGADTPVTQEQPSEAFMEEVLRNGGGA